MAVQSDAPTVYPKKIVPAIVLGNINNKKNFKIKVESPTTVVPPICLKILFVKVVCKFLKLTLKIFFK